MMKVLLLSLCVLMPLCVADTDNGLLARIEALERRCEEQDVQLQQQQVNSKKYEEHQTLMTSQLTQEVDSLKELLSNNEHHLKASLMAQLNRNSRFLADGAETIAFHATLSGGTHAHYQINQTVVFDKVMLNVGNGYHPTHGLFIAPYSGVYIFSVSIMNSGGTNDSTMVFIKKNGQEIASAIADGRGAPHDQGSTTIVMLLDIGDEVWVSIERHNDTMLWGDGLDSFMGCLITQL